MRGFLGNGPGHVESVTGQGRESQDAYLSIYLRDHHAAGSAGARLAARLARNVSAELGCGEELGRVAEEVAADLRTLERFMDAERVGRSGSKDVLAIVAGRLGGLKPNGRFRDRSPLSDLIELETLLVGLTGKASLWASLAERRPSDEVELQTCACGPRLRPLSCLAAATKRPSTPLVVPESRRLKSYPSVAALPCLLNEARVARCRREVTVGLGRAD